MRVSAKLASALLMLTPLAGFFLLSGPASALTDEEKLQRMLEVLNAPNPMPTEYGDAWVRFDRGQLVFGSPLQVPGNDWKKAPPDDNGHDWQTANGVDVGHPGEEPRYLGFTLQGDFYSNDWFPPDAEPQAPVQRNMIRDPWGRGLCTYNPPGIADYTWGVILRSLSNYHEKIGYTSPADGYAYNPAFSGQFDVNAIKDYFRVLSEPKPGITGAVREWHYRNGAPWYDTITIRWNMLPNFVVESIVLGTQLARPGETYTGTVKVKVEPNGSFVSDPLSWQLYDVL